MTDGSKVLATLRLLRVGTLFSPAADVTASLAILGLPWDQDAGRAVAASVCIYAAGMVWNDVADRKLDAVQRPERPLPSGALPLWFAVLLGTLLLTGGLIASPCRYFHLFLAGLVLAYDFALKKIDWLGALAMGTLRGLNLMTALLLPAGLDLDIAEGMDRGLDLRIAALCYFIYICAVTVLGIYEDRKSVSTRAVQSIQSAPPLAALVGILAVQGGLWPAPAIALVPILWFGRRNTKTREFDQAAIRRSMMYLLLGTMLYTALLAVAAGRWVEAGAIAGVILPARWIARRIALT